MGADQPQLHLQNALTGSLSPYLRAHKDNPVAWQEWNEATIAIAKQHQRMIFLSIGYNACHWCHVMERESFSSPEVAEMLNTSFIPVKVDREIRPDIDEIYMNYVTATTGAGGWPLNVFLTPDLKPVFGGTYWPGPSPTTNLKPAEAGLDELPTTFMDILQKMQEVWTNQREKCIQSASDIVNQLREFAAEGTHTHSEVRVRGDNPSDDPPEPLDLDLLDDALSHFVSRYDNVFGGFSLSATSPKFPTPANLTFLLRIGAAIAVPSTHTRFGFSSPVPGILGKDSCLNAATMTLHTLLAMSRSALRDQLGHGFHRYSVTSDWNLPHFEKMMCDNAQLLGCYCDAWALGRNPEILGTIYSLVEYFTSPESPIVNPEGGWYSSESADSRTHGVSTANGVSDKKEGAFYVWRLKTIQSLLGDRDATILARHFGVLDHGNVPSERDVHDEFLQQNVLYISATPSVLAKDSGLPEDEVVRIIKAGRAKLLEYRKTNRERPDVDTKIIAAWNGLAISTLARAANTLAMIDKSRAKRCREAAEKGFAYIKANFFDDATGKLVRLWDPANSETKNASFVDDYAYLTLAALALYDLTLNPDYLGFAMRLQSTLDTCYISTTGGYFQTPSDVGEVIMRLKPGTDAALPSPNGIIATNLLYLSSYLQDRREEYGKKARNVLDAFAVEIIQHPFLYVSMLAAVVMAEVGVKTILAPQAMSEKELTKLKGWGRTVVRDNVDKVMICKDGVCRELTASDLMDEDEVQDLAEQPVTDSGLHDS